MEKNTDTILLSQSGWGNPWVNRGIILVLALIYMYGGTSLFVDHYDQQEVRFYLGIILMLLGMYNTLLAVWLLSASSGLVPRFALKDNKVSIRNYLYGKTVVIDLDQIKSVHLGTYEIYFMNNHNKENVYIIKTRKSSDAKKIRNMMREACARMGITVTER